MAAWIRSGSGAADAAGPTGASDTGTGELGFLHQGADGSDDHGRFERLAQYGVTAGRTGLLFVQRFELPGSENDPDVAVEFLDVAAQVYTAKGSAASSRKERIRDHQIRIDPGQARQGCGLIRYA
jgi:hypothetical protein